MTPTEKALKQLEKLREKIEVRGPTADMADTLIGSLPGVQLVILYFEFGTHNSVVVSMEDTATKEEYKAVVAALQREGWHTKDYKEDPDCRRIHTDLEKADQPCGIRVMQHLFSDKAKCQFVKVGTRTVEEPIYELQCEEPESSE